MLNELGLEITVDLVVNAEDEIPEEDEDE